MTTKVKSKSQELTLPFVGREEELKFLLDEYDRMLHAQYRSVWIEAPAGTGKTALVEEFLKRIDVAHPALAGCATSPVKPWIVHAHLRERSSNSLLTLVEALGVSLQSLSETQQQKLFSKLTSFYQERARKIVGGGNVQSMNMEEGITTAGYILKQLSFYFPLVVIIEDVHVLKGEMSFYALRQLQAITEHVPMIALYISRPSEEKQLAQFREQAIKEGCKKYEVDSLKYEDVEKLSANNYTVTDVKKLMHLSGGNALLLNQLLHSGDLRSAGKTSSITEQIISYLKRELEKLPKKDRQVVAIAGMLGEEFSEQLLEEITQSKKFLCWTKDALHRLEHRGIVKRRRKELIPEDTSQRERVTIRVSVFSHALWWEAARKLYQEEKKINTWEEKNFVQVIVPLLSHQDYPLLTDPELIQRLFQLASSTQLLKLINYTATLCSNNARWHFHSGEELLNILNDVKDAITLLLKNKKNRLTNESIQSMVDLMDALVFFTAADNNQAYRKGEDIYAVIEELLNLFPKQDDDVLTSHCINVFEKGRSNFFNDPRSETLTMTRRKLLSYAGKIHREDHPRAYPKCQIDLRALDAYQEIFRDAAKGAQLFYALARDCEKEDKGMAVYCLRLLLYFPVPIQIIITCYELARNMRESIVENSYDEFNDFYLVGATLAELSICLKGSLLQKAKPLLENLESLTDKIWHERLKNSLRILMLGFYSLEVNIESAYTIIEDIDDRLSLWKDEVSRFKMIHSSLFKMEDWERMEKGWQASKASIFPDNIAVDIRLLTEQLLMYLLLGNNEGCKEILALFNKISKRYPIARRLIKVYQKKLHPFFLCRKQELVSARKEFYNLLSGDRSLNSFDKAHYAQLFARIGVKYGHAPKEFRKYVNYSLQGFTKLGLPKRVVFTAEKFAEAGLISQKQLEQVREKYLLKKSSSKSPDKNITKYDVRTTNDDQGIHLQCIGEMSAFAPDGKEIVSRYWGKRKKELSHHKQIVLELVKARSENRLMTNDELIAILFRGMKSGDVSHKKLRKARRILSSRLSRLKQIFYPYNIIESTSEGIALHPSVTVDLFELEKSLAHAKRYLTSHPPSAAWILEKTKNTIDRSSQHETSSSLRPFQKRIREMSVATNSLLAEIKKQRALVG